MSDSKLVFSTDKAQVKQSKKVVRQKSSGPCRMRIEKKGRGGKTVTILFDLPFEKDEAKKIMKELQSCLATGASLKNGEIILNGEHRDEVEKIFKNKNLKLIRSGG